MHPQNNFAALRVFPQQNDRRRDANAQSVDIDDFRPGIARNAVDILERGGFAFCPETRQQRGGVVQDDVARNVIDLVDVCGIFRRDRCNGHAGDRPEIVVSRFFFVERTGKRRFVRQKLRDGRQFELTAL